LHFLCFIQEKEIKKIDKKRKKKKKNQKLKNILEFGMTSIPLRCVLLGDTL